MAIFRTRLIDLTIVVVSVTVFVTGAYLAFNQLVTRQNSKSVGELNAQALRRSEMAVDYAFTALVELAEQGAAGCDQSTISELRRAVHQRSTVKDIRIVDASGRVLCSAFPENVALDVETSWDYREAARNALVQVFSLTQTTGPAFGIAWKVASDVSLVAVVNADALLYDILPDRLREEGEIALSLTSGRQIARYTAGEQVQDERALIFKARSERYPVLSSIRIDAIRFSSWNRELQPFALVLGGGVGLLFGFLLRRLARRPIDPVVEIDRALARGEFRPFLQPIFSLQSGEIVGCEILARWVRADGTIVQPYQFIPLAERSGRIVKLTYQIALEAFCRLRPWMKRNKSFKVGVNIGAPHLLSPGFVDEIRAVVADARISPRQVVIELTEREAIGDLKRAARVIDELRAVGFRVAIDDAGTGHSGLSYIQTLAITTIKIDKFFVDAIGRDPAAKAVVGLLVRLAAELKMATVAEGIETEDQIRVLRSIGVDEGQGYIVSPALPADGFLALLESRIPADSGSIPPLQASA